MAEVMSLEQARDDMRSCESAGGGLTGRGVFKQWADAIDAHIAKSGAYVPPSKYHGWQDDHTWVNGDWCNGWNACRDAMLASRREG